MRIQKDMSEHEKKVASSAEMFKKTKITSCSKILAKNGQAVCMAFTNGAPKPVNPTEKKLPETTSMNTEQYKPRENLHAGMIKKPLEPYHPNAHRSRLPQPTVVMPYKNSSSIVIGDRSTYYKRQFKSTNQNVFVKPKPFESSNQGIISSLTQRGHHLQN